MLKRTYILTLRPLGKQAHQLATWRLKLAMELGLPCLETMAPQVVLGRGSTPPSQELVQSLRRIPWPAHGLREGPPLIRDEDMVLPLEEVFPGSQGLWMRKVQEIISPWFAPVERPGGLEISLGQDPSVKTLTPQDLTPLGTPPLGTLGSMEIVVVEVHEEMEKIDHPRFMALSEGRGLRIKKMPPREYIDLLHGDRSLQGRKVPRGSTLGPHDFHLVAMGMVRLDDGTILITQRSQHKLAGGLWECTAGSVQAGETSDQAVIREIREELGIDASIVAGPYSDYSEGNAHFDIYVCSYGGPRDRISMQEDEVQDFRFVGFAEIQALHDQGLGTKSFSEILRLWKAGII